MTGVSTGPATRLRVRYSKTGKVRFTSHRDVVRMWERALRRSDLAVAWTEGFSPRPQLSFGHALPTGAESFAEYLDVSLVEGPCLPTELVVATDRVATDRVATDRVATVRDATERVGGAWDERWEGIAGQLSALLPEGVDVQAIAPLDPGSGSLQQEVSSCSWKLEVFGLAAEELASRVERLLAAPTALVERERKGRTAPDDLRPAVLALAVAPRADGEPVRLATHSERSWLEAELATRPRGVRPKELLEVVGPGVRLSRACRMHQWIERDGTRAEPLVAPGREAGTVAAHAGRRAP